MRQVYGERMDALKEAADRHLRGALDLVRAGSGMRTVGWLQTAVTDVKIAERARSLGLELSALSQFTIRYTQRPALVLGFAGCTPSELRRGVRVLETALSG
jgi:GntR family transcriptional regulator / MocR family aminotransferase